MSIQFTNDFKEQPYWWEGLSEFNKGEQALPASTDVLIIGSGYTGLCAGLQTSQGGRHTVIIDSENPGWGCSSRNGGQISTSIKPSYESLSKKYGSTLAFDIVQEGRRALKWIGDLIEREKIDCEYRKVGRFDGAHTPAQFKSLIKEYENQPQGLELEYELIDKANLHKEIDTPYYHGGVIRPDNASLQPALYHRGLCAIAQNRGCQLISHCKAMHIEKEKNAFLITTSQGVIRAKQVLVATNGYTSSLTPWQRRRIIPIGSYLIATEELPRELIRQLIPNDRMICDTRKLVVYYRASPDGRRIIFGGRVSIQEGRAATSAAPLFKLMTQIFPQLSETAISHSWMGFVGYTFDHLPHLGQHDGLYYSMGYCGSGISLATYFGSKIGLQMIGDQEGKTALDNLSFQTRPLYTGNPWFLVPTVGYYKIRDRLI